MKWENPLPGTSEELNEQDRDALTGLHSRADEIMRKAGRPGVGLRTGRMNPLLDQGVLVRVSPGGFFKKMMN